MLLLSFSISIITHKSMTYLCTLLIVNYKPTKYRQNLPQQTEKKKGGGGGSYSSMQWININLVVSETKKFFMRFVYLGKFFIAFSNDPVFDQSFLLFL